MNKLLLPRPKQLTRWVVILDFAIYKIPDTWHTYEQINAELPLPLHTYESHTVDKTTVIGTLHICDKSILKVIYGKYEEVIHKWRKERTSLEKLDDTYRYYKLLPHLLWLPLHQ